MLTVGQAFASKRNHFDLLRAVCALSVLFAHSYGLATKEPSAAAALAYDIAHFGLCSFFTISGFLVTRSVLEHGIVTYAGARIFRILPPLAFIVLFSVYVIGPLFSTLPFREFIRHHLTRWYLQGQNALSPHAFGLPGVFKDNLGDAVNGSLWTLPYEFFLYMLLPVFAALGLLRARVAFVAPLVTVVAAVLATRSLNLGWDNYGPFVGIYPQLLLFPLLHYGAMFLFGSALYVYRDRVPLSVWIALALLAATVLLRWITSDPTLMSVAFPYLTLYLALGLRLPHDPTRWTGDLSFGIYGYAFPVQQGVVALHGGRADPMLVMLYSVPIVLILAVCSWRLIERPCLRLRHDLKLEQIDRWLLALRTEAWQRLAGRRGAHAGAIAERQRAH